jgi:hypothetical protein
VTKLVIGKESIEVKAAKKKVLSNLRLLNSRLQGLCRSSASFDALHEFYSQKVDEQLSILEWFEKFDRATTSADPVMRNSRDPRMEPADFFTDASPCR